MTEFKHGDIVRISDPSWRKSRLYMKTGVIERNPRRQHSNYPFLFFVHPINTDSEGVPMKGDEFELVKRPFKDGDKVRIIGQRFRGSQIFLQEAIISRNDDGGAPSVFPFVAKGIRRDGEPFSVGVGTSAIELVKEKEVTTEFQVGDKVSVTGTVTEIYGQNDGKAITIDFDGDRSIDTEREGVACVWDYQVTLIERPEKEIPVGTIVPDAAGNKYILGSYEGNFGTHPAWIRFVGSGRATWTTDSEQGKILSAFARAAL